MPNFKSVIAQIELQKDIEVLGTRWKANLIKITENEKKLGTIRILIKFTIDDFSFEKELKLVENHFESFTKHENEIQRQLDRLDRYTNSIEDFQMLVIESFPNITNKWKGALTGIDIKSPIESILTFTFAQTNGFFEKKIFLRAESFMKKSYYSDWLDTQVVLLNEPVSQSYFENLIQSI